MPDKPQLLYFDRIGNDADGYLTTTQYAQNLPFAVKRVFWTYSTPPGVKRGNHANRTTEEVLVAIAGSIQVKTIINGEEQSFELNNNTTGLYIPAMCWAELNLSEEAVALCLASTDFDEHDYIRSFDEFLKLT